MQRLLCGAIILLAGCNGGTTPAPTVPTSSPAMPPSTPTPVQEAVVEPDTPFTLEEGFRQLARGDFEAFSAENGTWSEITDGIACSGKPRGYLYTRDSFQNFTWRLEYRFPRPESLIDDSKFKGNTGFMIYITGEPKIWPLSLEVQGKHVQMGTIKETGGANAPMVEDHPEVRESARKPVGQWNRLEIVSKDGELHVLLNDQPLCKSAPDFLSSGAIGIQAEDFPFEVRRMRVRIDL